MENPQVLAAQVAPRRVSIGTPEQVELGFEVADLGSRFVALLVDIIVLGAALLGLALLAWWAAGTWDLPALVSSMGLAAFSLLFFLLTWGYFVYFEAFRGGRTPGKRWTGIRVIHEGSQPLTLRGAVIRNLIRAVDAQPVGTWLVGGLVMWLNPRTQRLGDLAAATLVVRDRGAAEVTPEQLAGLVRQRGMEPRLTDAEFDALARFVGRRDELDRHARARLASRLTEVLAPHLEGVVVPSSGRGPDVEKRLAALHEEERPRREVSRLLGRGASPLARSLVLGQADRWIEYRSLLDRAGRRGLTSLPGPEVERFAALYRTVAADLARARTYGASGPLVFSLERWVGAGHNLLYRPTGRSWRALLDWLAHGFPTRVRARRMFVAGAAALLFLPAFGTYAAVRMDPPLARDLMPHGMIVRAETARERAEAGGGYVEVPEVFMPVMASRLIANNVQVTFFAFAGGILAGVGTALLLLVNGIHFGAAAALFRNEGAAALLWEFVAPHGVMEITAVCIAGGAGLLLGSALIAPGRLRRADALAERAREAVSLLAGTTMLLVLAGLIEGFVSPAQIPVAAKLTIAGMVALGVVAYLLLGGRGVRADPGT
jgi:uncharacterized membrane protein SpoIIM required for sporulation/uncharacterized RDD family membrane protein YckC